MPDDHQTELSSAATAQTLSTLGYGLFAWLQPGDLELIHDMRAVTQAVEAEAEIDAVVDAEPVGTTPLALPEQGHGPDTLFDEDLAAAELMAELSSYDEVDVEALSASLADVPPIEEPPASSYSTHRDTIAMLEEIAFLDE